MPGGFFVQEKSGAGIFFAHEKSGAGGHIYRVSLWIHL